MGAVTAVLAPVFGSATADGRALLDCDAAVRAPLPLCRRIGFVHLAAGSGGSTTAAQAATVLARRRTGMVLAVDASPSPRGLLALLGAAGGRSDPAVRSGATTAAGARAGLGRAPGGCYALDLRPAPADAWSAAVGPIARFFDVIVTDWGLRHPAYDLEPVLSSSHAVCLVVRADDTAVAAATGLLHALRGRPATPPVVVALVAGDRGARRLPRPVVVLGPTPGPRRQLRLAAELMRPTGGDGRDG
jgi:MinD-like ATPase involved in chromosome partitioning or flagellar assembly